MAHPAAHAHSAAPADRDVERGKIKGAGRSRRPSRTHYTHHGLVVGTSHMPALISVCSVAAFAASFCCSAAAIEAVKALVSFICWMA